MVHFVQKADIVSDFYQLDKSCLLSERKIVATSIELTKKEEVLKAAYELIKWLHENGIGDILPTFKTAATIFAAIPTTSCSAEQSFSALRRITRPSRPIRRAMWIVERMRYPTDRPTDRQTNGHSQL